MAEPGFRLSDERVVELVNSRAEHAKNHYVRYMQRLSRWYDLYRGIYSGKFQQFRNSVHIPFLFSVVQSDVAKKVQTSFGSWPIVSFSGYAPEDEPIARKNEVLVSAQMKDCDSFAKATDFFLTADLYGTGICRHGWTRKVRKEKWRDETAPGVEMTFEGEVTRFDGPDWQVVDPLDFWPQPGFRRISDMAWVIHRYFLDLDDVEDMAAQGVFDKSAVQDLKDTPPSSEIEANITERLSIYRNYAEYEARRTEKFAKPVEIREMWGLVPKEFAPDGVRMRVISIGNQRTLMRNRPSPFWHGEIPFIAYSPQPDPHYFHGVGKCEVGEKMQVTANRFANQKLDAIDIFLDPVVLANRQAGIDTSQLYMRAGLVIGVDGPVDDSQIRPLSPDLKGLQQSYAEISQLWQWIQQGTGIVEDVVQGMPSGGRQTAREYIGRQEQVLTRLMLECRLAEEGFIEPLANAFRHLNRQYLKTPHELKILGSMSVVDPLTGLPMPQENTIIDLADINPDYRARAVGSSQMLGKGSRQQNLIAVLQAITANPLMMQLVNWPNFTRQLFEAFDMQDPNSLMVQGMIPMLNQMGAAGMGAGLATGGSPEELMNPGQNGMPPLDPNVLGAMSGTQPMQPMAPFPMQAA